MSYILEALKKAEAERNGAPIARAPLLPPFAAASRHPPAWRLPLPWAGLAALAVSLACAAWYAVSGNDNPQSTAAAQPLAPALSKAAPEVTPPQAAAPHEIPSPPPAAATAPVKPKAKPAPNKTAEKKRKPAAKITKTAKATPPEPAVGTLRDLPEQLQREIPPLSVGGYIYSGNKADRSVLINKKLLREGDEVAPGLVLEKMMPNGMVLNYKGYRYRRGY